MCCSAASLALAERRWMRDLNRPRRRSIAALRSSRHQDPVDLLEELRRERAVEVLRQVAPHAGVELKIATRPHGRIL